LPIKCNLQRYTEGALKVLAEKIGVESDIEMSRIVDLRETDPARGCQGVSAAIDAECSKLATLEFDRGRKSMSVIVKAEAAGDATPAKRSTRTPTRAVRSVIKRLSGGSGGNKLLVKGAPECVLERCTQVQLPDGAIVALTDGMRAEIAQVVSKMSASALRCLGFAVKSGSALKGGLATYDGTESHPAHAMMMDPNQYSDIESDLVFVGLAGLRDPPRPEVRGAIEACATAGIRVVVITGDNKLTAEVRLTLFTTTLFVCSPKH
jgi:Ca2+-transporting ATPase